MNDARLELRGVVATAGGVRLLSGVDLAVRTGEITVVVGPSGAGKSTLLRAMLGMPPAGGSLTYTGALARGPDGYASEPSDVDAPEWTNVRRRLVGIVPQAAAASLDPLRTIEHEYFAAAHRRSVRSGAGDLAAALSAVGLRDPADIARRRPNTLSGGEAQRAALAVAEAGSPPIFLLDEPTSALDPTVAADLLRRLRRAVDAGRAGALIVTHDPRVAAATADRVVVLSGGRVVEVGAVEAFFAGPSSSEGAAFVAAGGAEAKRARPPSETRPTLTIDAVSKTYDGRPALHPTSCEIAAGSAWGILGESGAGKSTLARIIAGLERPDRGRVSLGGSPPGRRVQLVWQDAFLTLDPRRPAGDAVVETLRARGLRGAVLAEATLRAATTAGLTAAHLERRPAALSGGERQRIGLARGLAADPDILIADEAFAALDAPLRHAVSRRLAVRSDGSLRAVVLVTHDLALARALVDHAIFMDQGRVVASGPAEDVLFRPADPRAARFVASLLPARPADRTAWLKAGSEAAPGC